MARVRLGFVGVGFMGQIAHLRNYASLQECEVVALAEPRPHLREKVAARYGVPQTFATHREMLESVEVDAVIASQPYTRHAVLIPEILDRKVAVFTEKPVALSVEAGEALAAKAAAQAVTYMVGYHKRSDPAMEYAVRVIRDWKASGEFGAMRLVRASMPPGDWIVGGDQEFIRTDEDYPKGETEPRPAGMDEATARAYDAFVNYYIHQVNAIRFLLGEDYSVTYAEKTGVLMAGESESGVCATLEMTAYATRHVWQESYLVGFEKGCVRIELPGPLAHYPGRVTILRDAAGEVGEETCPLLPNRYAMLNQAHHFVAAVKGDRPAPCDAAEAVKDLRVARDYIFLQRGK